MAHVRGPKPDAPRGSEQVSRKGRWVWGILGLVMLGALGLYSYSLTTSPSPDPPRIEVEPARFDWGTIPNDTPVTRAFTVRNGGDRPLEITGISTSCGCTTASLEDARLAAGETAELRVTFDPTTHPGLTGPVLRMVYLRSTDPVHAEVAIELRAILAEPEGELGGAP